MAQVVVEMTSDEQRLWRGMQKIVSQQDKMERGFTKVGRAGQRAGKQTEGIFGGGALRSVAAYATSVVSIAGAVAGMKQSYEVWLKNIRETSAATRTAAQELIAFAALQEGGTVAGRVREVSKMAAGYGITEFGKGWAITQALQSAFGSYAKGKAGGRTVMAAAQVGLPLESGQRVEAMGATLGMEAGELLRQTYVAGQISPESPALIAKAAAGMVQFKKDPILGSAAAAILSGSFPTKLETYLRAAGVGLAGGKGEAEKTFKKLGVADASMIEKLEALREAGLDEPKELLLAGFSELRRRDAIAVLVQNLPKLKAAMKRIEKEAAPGLFGVERGVVERGMPIMALERHNRMLEAAFKEERALGPVATRAAKAQREQAVLGLAFQRLGITQAGPFDVVSEEGLSTFWDKMQFLLVSSLIPGAGRGAAGTRTWGAVKAEMEAIRGEFGLTGEDYGGQAAYEKYLEESRPQSSELLEETRKLRVATEEVARNTRGQPALNVASNEDR